MKQFTLRTAFLFMVLGFAIGGFTAGCNTMEGAGEDVERAGEKIQETADDAQD
jgi:predicted small secreted protein